MKDKLVEDEKLIGPNAVLQMLNALMALEKQLKEPGLTSILAHKAGVQDYLFNPPDSMAPLDDAVRLFAAVEKALPIDMVEALFQKAGRLTGDYIIANRIPGFAKALFKILPGFISARILARAIEAHAWTFVGDGDMKVWASSPICFVLSDCSLKSPGDLWHTAVFDCLYQRLIGDRWVMQASLEPAGSGYEPYRVFTVNTVSKPIPLSERLMHAFRYHQSNRA